MTPIHCTGCGRRMGYTPNRFPGYKYCRPWEHRLPRFTEHHERDALLLELIRSGVSVGRATAEFGFTRQRGQQIIRARTSEDADPAAL